MRYSIVTLLATFMVSGAFAEPCSVVYQDNHQIDALLGNKRVEANDPVSGENWKEDHCLGSGALYKVGLGPNDPIDPRKQVGTWTYDNTAATVTYNYDGNPGSKFTWTVKYNRRTGNICWEGNGQAIAYGTATDNSLCN